MHLGSKTITAISKTSLVPAWNNESVFNVLYLKKVCELNRREKEKKMGRELGGGWGNGGNKDAWNMVWILVQNCVAD